MRNPIKHSTIVRLVATCLSAILACSAAFATMPAAGPTPPPVESAAARAHRFATWHATHTDDAARIRRAIAETEALAAARRKATPEPGDPRAVSPVIFRTSETGAALWDCAMCPEMVIAPAGIFDIGSPDDEPGRGKDEAPRRQITLAYPFAVGRFEVARGEYEAFLKATAHPVRGGCVTDRAHKGEWSPEPNTTLRDPGFKQADNHPVACVNWDDAQAYIAWLNAQTDGGYRLLTEAEWEFVARAGTTTAYPWGADVNTGCSDANGADATLRDKYPDYAAATCRDGALNTAPVGSYRANAFGLYDLIGNMGEWVQDCATLSYENLPTDGSADPSGDCAKHVVRGGSWGTMTKDYRVANRVRYAASAVDDSIGIRVAKTLR